MLIEYVFPVTGHAKIGQNYRFPLRNRQYHLVCGADDYLNEIRLSCRVESIAYWPRVTETPDQTVKAHIDIRASPDFASICSEMRALEGLLALYGVRGINTRRYTMNWCPESEAEAKQLGVSSFTNSVGNMRDHPHKPIDPNILLQSVIAAPNIGSAETPLNFHRKGCLDIEEERYIDAIYDLYFCLETHYGNGATKNYKIKQAFLDSELLCRTITEEITDFRAVRDPTLEETKYFSENYRNRTIEEVVAHIVSLRGRLHHHSLKNPDRWHPDDHFRYRVDALLLWQVCGVLSLGLSFEYILDDEVANFLPTISVEVFEPDVIR